MPGPAWPLASTAPRSACCRRRPDAARRADGRGLRRPAARRAAAAAAVGACRARRRAELAALVRFGWRATRPRGRAARPRRAPDRLAPSIPPKGEHPMLASLSQDVRYAARSAARSRPASRSVCIATVALAIGANTAIFSVVHGVMLKALPFADPDRAGGARPPHRTAATRSTAPRPGNLYDWMAGATGVRRDRRLRADRAHRRPSTAAPSASAAASSVGGLFEVLGAPAARAGPSPRPTTTPGAEPVVVLERAAGAAPVRPARAAVGQSLTINGDPHTVVGVMPRGLRVLRLRLPSTGCRRASTRRSAAIAISTSWRGLARLKPGVVVEQAERSSTR